MLIDYPLETARLVMGAALFNEMHSAAIAMPITQDEITQIEEAQQPGGKANFYMSTLQYINISCPDLST